MDLCRGVRGDVYRVLSGDHGDPGQPGLSGGLKVAADMAVLWLIASFIRGMGDAGEGIELRAQGDRRISGAC